MYHVPLVKTSPCDIPFLDSGEALVIYIQVGCIVRQV